MQNNELDYRKIFEALPGAYLILSPKFLILAATDSYLQLTRTKRDLIVNQYVFDVFPDNPDEPSATGVADLTESFNKVLITKKAHKMSALRYDIPSQNDPNIFEAKYWRLNNSPIVDENRDVIYIVNFVDEITHLVDALGEAMNKAKEN